MITTYYGLYLILAIMLFIIGAIGFVVRKNLLIVLMSLELMFNGVNLSLITFNKIWLIRGGSGFDGHIFALISIAIAAAEVAVGLAIAVVFYRNFSTTRTDVADRLKE